MELVQDIVSWALFSSGSLMLIIGGLGLIRLPDFYTRLHGPQGIVARTWPTGSTVLWVAFLLGFTLILYYL